MGQTQYFNRASYWTGSSWNPRSIPDFTPDKSNELIRKVISSIKKVADDYGVGVNQEPATKALLQGDRIQEVKFNSNDGSFYGRVYYKVPGYKAKLPAQVNAEITFPSNMQETDKSELQDSLDDAIIRILNS